MYEIESLWNQFDIFRQTEVKCEEKIVKTDIYRCNCGGKKVFNGDEMPTCTLCGEVAYIYITDTAEWASGLDDSGKVTDHSRCGAPQDLDLFSSQWGSASIIFKQGKQTYSQKRMAKINFHLSMNHRDRALFHAYKDIERPAKDVLNLTDSIVRDAKVLYRKFNCEKLTRGAIRSGIKANCVMYACKLSNVPRTTKEIADAFDIPTRDISRTAQIFKETILGETTATPKPSITRSSDVVHRLLNSFNLGSDRQIRIKCIRMCKKLDNCTTLMSKTPSSIASVVVLLSLGPLTTKQDVCEKCGISMPTLSKIEALVKAYLEETPD